MPRLAPVTSAILASMLPPPVTGLEEYLAGLQAAGGTWTREAVRNGPAALWTMGGDRWRVRGTGSVVRRAVGGRWVQPRAAGTQARACGSDRRALSRLWRAGPRGVV